MIIKTIKYGDYLMNQEPIRVDIRELQNFLHGFISEIAKLKSAFIFHTANVCCINNNKSSAPSNVASSDKPSVVNENSSDEGTEKKPDPLEGKPKENENLSEKYHNAALQEERLKNFNKKIILNHDHQGKVNLIISSDIFTTNLSNFNALNNDAKISFWLSDYNNLYELYNSIYSDLLGANENETIEVLRKKYFNVRDLILKKFLELHSYLLEVLKITHQNRHDEKIQKKIEGEREKIKTKTYAAYNYFIKTLLVLNAGAVVALLAYISEKGPHVEIARQSIIYFGMGIISSILLLFFLTLALIIINNLQNKYLGHYKSGKINFYDYYFKNNWAFKYFGWVIPLAFVPLVFFIIGFILSTYLLRA